jgi:vacuolar protein sorting-associated protein 13A/C
MLESLVANLLNRFLGMYVQNFDPKQLNVGIWSGDVALRNLELRREALDQLKLPLNVVEGHLGLLTLSIPWSNLRGKPVKINISDVYLLAAPRTDAEVDPAEEERRSHAVKMEKLDSAELLKERNTEGMSQEDQQKNQSFTSSLVTAIVDNVQITVKNIHVRYEDSISNPEHPFALGITLEGFDAVSTDENWVPTFIQSTSATTHKIANLKSLAVYWDTDAKLLGTGKGSQSGIEHAEFLERFKGLTVKDEEGKANEDHQFILKPVTGRAGLEMDKTGKLDRPKVKAKMLFDELGFIIDDDQYRDALMLVDLFHYFIRHQEYKKFQPKSKPLEDPQAWLRFAGQAVLDKIHDRNKRWSWEFFKERRDDRIRYIDLFKKKKKEEKLTPDESKDMDRLEHKLTYEDLRFWRSLARNQLRKENVGVKKAPQKQTWSQWVWGGGKKEEASDESQMSDQQRKELYSAINFDEKQSIAEAVELPKEYVKLQADLSLRTGSFTLKKDPHGKGTEILRLLFDSFKTQFLQRPGSFLAKVSLEGMRLYDGTTEGSLFPQMITIKGAPQIPDDQRIEELQDDDEDATKDGDGENENEKLNDAEEEPEDPFFQLEFENNPLDGSADMALNLKLKGMEFIYNPAFVVGVVKFFKPPERHMESIGALMESAGKTVEAVRAQTRAGLEFALEEHKTVNANLDITAPLIIVPDSVTKKSKICLIIDAGHASVKSELVDKETLQDIQSKQREKLSDADFKRLESLMYDKFKLDLTSTQVLIGTTIEETRAKLDDKASNFHLVDKINVDFLVETCIVPKGTSLTRFKVSGHLPVLKANISDQKYKSLMKVIDFAIPRFGDDLAAAETVEDKPEDGAALQPAKTDEDRRGSFTFAAQRHELVMEEESVAGDIEENFKDAKPPADQLPMQMHTKTFELKFTVDKLQGSLYKSDSEGKKDDQLLVELVAEGFLLNFYLRPFDMAAAVRLRTLAVVDHVEEDPLPEFRNIIESEKVEGQDLFELQFVKVNKESPEFLTEYEGIGMNLDVKVSTINLIVTRRTLLTLLDFVLLTFTNPGQPAEQPKAIESGATPDQQIQPANPQDADKIRVRADLKRIAVVLNNDGIRLATLGLNTANVSVFLMGKKMRIGAHLGDLQLIDDVNQGVSEKSNLRQLVTIQGDELAHFSYETYDDATDAYPGYDTSIYLRAGSLKVNFVTEPFRKIMDFGVKFGKMQAIFNAARQAAANQANQLQQKASKMHFDIVVKTPIVVFPRMVITDEPERDTLTAELGEIYANNSFVALDDSEGADQANKISAGIRNVRLLSYFHYDEGQAEELQMIEKLDLDFKINMVEHKPGYKRPDMEIEGSLSDLNLKISQEQMRFALELSKSIPAAFTTEPDEEIQEQIEEEVPEETLQPARRVTSPIENDGDESERPTSSSLSPELGSKEGTWTKLDLVFKVGAIGLELINGKDNEPIRDAKEHSLSAFALNHTHVKLRMISDGSLESELLVQSLSIRDTRTQGANRFRKIMSLINTDVKQQFMASVSVSGGDDKNLVALLTVDSPRMIFSLDYVFALKGWLDGGLATEGPLDIEDQLTEMDESRSVSTQHSAVGELPRSKSQQLDAAPVAEEKPAQTSNALGVSFRVNVVDAQIVLIANPAISASEAIVLGTKQVLIAKQHAMTLQVDKIGMFLCRMDKFEENRLRILDDFSIQTSLDMRSQGKESSLTSINVDIEPLVLRLSLRDILLAMQIFNRASAMSNDEDKEMPHQDPKKLAGASKGGSSLQSRRKSSVKPPSTTRGGDAKTIATTKSSKSLQPPHPGGQASTILTREEMKVVMAGIRVVLIGDKHELPMLDWSVKKFNVDVRDWTSNMTADTRLDTFLNVYNFSKSAWEPLIEPWSLGFHMSKETNPDKLAVELYSKKNLELTMTSATIALASKSADFLSSDEDVLAKPRGMDAPYRIRNHTGFDLNVWAESKDNDDGSAAKLEDGQETPWRFEDAMTTRETLSSEGASGVVGVKLEGSGFNSVDKISVSREGEKLYNLYPKKDKIQHRLLVEVKLGTDNIKYITFRSPLLIENNTQIPVEMGVLDPEAGNILKIEKIAPGDGRPAPVGAAYMHSLIIRPDQGFGYTWCRERLFWKDLLKRSTRTLTCRHENEGEDAPPFYFQMHAAFDEKNPLTR